MSVGAASAQGMSHLVATAETAMPLAVVTLAVSIAASLAFYLFLAKRGT
jgi:DHA1 family bicyclomycin/chloramphenicol resistance-like MFS transporter